MVKAVFLGGPTPIQRLMPFFPSHCLDVDPSLPDSPRPPILRCETEDDGWPCSSYGTTRAKRGWQEKENAQDDSVEPEAKIRRVEGETRGPSRQKDQNAKSVYVRRETHSPPQQTVHTVRDRVRKRHGRNRRNFTCDCQLYDNNYFDYYTDMNVFRFR